MKFKLAKIKKRLILVTIQLNQNTMTIQRNQSLVGKMKGESEVVVIKKFVALKPKTYLLFAECNS